MSCCPDLDLATGIANIAGRAPPRTADQVLSCRLRNRHIHGPQQSPFLWQHPDLVSKSAGQTGSTATFSAQYARPICKYLIYGRALIPVPGRLNVCFSWQSTVNGHRSEHVCVGAVELPAGRVPSAETLFTLRLSIPELGSTHGPVMFMSHLSSNTEGKETFRGRHMVERLVSPNSRMVMSSRSYSTSTVKTRQRCCNRHMVPSQ